MSQSTDTENKNTALPQPMGLIEKAWEWRWAVRLSYAVIFADMALLVSGQNGILQLSLSAEYIGRHFGAICVAVCVFGALVSFIIPVSAVLLRQLILLCLSTTPWPSFLFRDNPRKNPTGWVRLQQFLDQALAEKSDFLHAIYQRHAMSEKRIELHREQVGMLIFGLLGLGILDNYLPILATTHTSLIATTLTASGEWSNHVWASAITLGCFLLRGVWFPGWETHWVYYPPLYRELRAREIAEQKEQEALIASGMNN